MPAQTGIRDQRTADAMRLLYPRRLNPTVQEDTVSISALGRAYAAAPKEERPEGAAGVTVSEAAPEPGLENTEEQVAPSAPQAAAPRAAYASPEGGGAATGSTWVA